MSSRVGLAPLTNNRANGMATTPATPMSTKPVVASGTPNGVASSAVAPSSATKDGEQRPRLSGGKREHEELANNNAGAPPTNTEPVQKKKKITYALPYQNMEEGHFYVVLGEDIDASTGRFKILSLLGEGTFGKVVEAWDRKRKEYCAVKIVRNVPKYTRDATIEIQFMERVRRHDETDKVPLMKIQRHFQNETGHMCIVMKKYGPCMLDWIQKQAPLNHRSLAEVVFLAGVALDYFHSEMRLIHTDLKPENMLLENGTATTDPVTGKPTPASSKIVLCDLGGCCDERHSRSAIVSTRHYRSPEVILGLGWMFSTDMWSMGCIIYELFTGRLLYDTHDNLEHLHLMEKTLSRLPSDWPSKATGEGAGLFSATTGQLRPCTEAKHLARISRTRPVRDVIQDELLRDLIYGLLHYDRTRRMTARGMTTCPYVMKYFPECVNSPMHPNNRGRMAPVPLN